MMHRRRFLLTSLAGVLAAPLVVEPQQTDRVHRIGWVMFGELNEKQLGLYGGLCSREAPGG